MKILVCDDRADNCKQITDSIAQVGLSDIVIEPLCGENGADLKDQLGILFERVRRFLPDGTANTGIGDLPATKFDDVDLVVLDNNLSHLETAGARITAEAVAGYVRAFTNSPYVISLNKNPEVDFDLRFLVGDFETRADLALNLRHLPLNALWTGVLDDTDRNAFHPWYWPVLLNEPKRRIEQKSFIESNLDKSVFSAFDFPENAIDALSRHALGFLSPASDLNGSSDPENKAATEITFRDVFLYSARSIPDRGDRDTLNTLSHTDSRAREILVRSVVSDIDLWFRRDVIGPQEALVDIPHLIARMPFLLGDKAGDIGNWNRALRTNIPPYSLDENLFESYLKPAAFQHAQWSTSPCFWWPKLKDNHTLNQLFVSSAAGWADGAFCEDLSVFKELSSGTEGDIREFVAEFEGPWDRRHVSRVSNFKYAPRSRFAL